MKGIKTTLDTKVQPNLMTDWRKIQGYDKSVDAIVKSTSKYTDIKVQIPNPVAGDVYTVSFDAWGSTEQHNIGTHMYHAKDIIACAAGGDINVSDNGHVEWFNLSQKSKRYFTTYRLAERATYIIIRARLGTTYIRNIKLEKSPYPTDYEE